MACTHARKGEIKNLIGGAPWDEARDRDCFAVDLGADLGGTSRKIPNL